MFIECIIFLYQDGKLFDGACTGGASVARLAIHWSDQSKDNPSVTA